MSSTASAVYQYADARRTILCYGDSNTWGNDPAQGGRLASVVRWSGRLRTELGDAATVIEEGCNGRTTVRDDPLDPHRNGREYLIPCLLSHAPLDLVVLLLGTNDLKAHFALTAADIAAGIASLIDVVHASSAGRFGTPPSVLVVAPAPLVATPHYAAYFSDASIATSRQLATAYEDVARAKGAAFLDAGSVTGPCAEDGVHLGIAQHRALATAVAAKVRAVLGLAAGASPLEASP